MMSLISALAALTITASTDLTSLDAAIENCKRDTVLPVFAAEPALRNAFLTEALKEQAAISAERLQVANKRRVLRESALPVAPGMIRTPAPSEREQDLALAQLALDDRQRALDDRRRLESMRHDALDAKRQYFLTRCGLSKQRN